MRDHVVSSESHHNRLALMRSTIEESMKVQIMISWLSESTNYAPVIVSQNTMQEHARTWNHVIKISIREHKMVAGH